MALRIYNLHCHTPFSDGAHSIDELCEAHLSCAGIRVDGVGISDHLFRTQSSRELRDARDFDKLFANEARRYVAHVAEARRRWAGRMDVLCGCEINWPLNKSHLDGIRELIATLEMDYILFEYVDWAGLTQLAHQARRWPCPIGLAHTQVDRQMPATSHDQIVRTMANARIFFEINAKFLPLSMADRWFQILPHHRVSITMGTDTHDDLASIRQIADLYDFVQRRGLAEKLLQPARRVDEAIGEAAPVVPSAAGFMG